MLTDHVFARKGVVTVLGMSNSLKFYFIFISLKYLDQHLIKETSLPIPRHTMYFFTGHSSHLSIFAWSIIVIG